MRFGCLGKIPRWDHANASYSAVACAPVVPGKSKSIDSVVMTVFMLALSPDVVRCRDHHDGPNLHRRIYTHSSGRTRPAALDRLAVGPDKNRRWCRVDGAGYA